MSADRPTAHGGDRRAAGRRPEPPPAGRRAAAPAGPPHAAGPRAGNPAGGRPVAAEGAAGPRRTAGPRARAAAPRPRPGRPAPRPPRPAPRGTGPSALRGAARLPARIREAWDRPLTAYYVILGAGSLITVLGLVMVYSASQIIALQYGLPSTYYFRKQLLAVAIGSVLLWSAVRLSVRLHRALAYPLLLGSVFLMSLVQVPGIGQTVNGNTNWLSVGGPFQLQPSEFGKLALVMWGADLLARKNAKNLLAQWKHLLVPLVPVAVLLLGLIMLGGDMGTTVILTAVLFGLLWLAGAPTRLFTGVLAAATALGALAVATSANRMGRLHCIGASSPGPNDQCWQAVHGIYALASGGWFGSGLGASVEKWGELPEPHTDFIFAVTGEELGLAGTLSVLALFAALGYAGIRVAGRTEDPFVRFAAGGVTTWITVQAVINIGAVLGLLPIAGVPLPLFSYGGSALLPTMFAVGLLICFARNEPAARAALAVRSRNNPLTRAVRRTMRRRARRRPSGER
ncbi:putative lipid II flippase FtsW [Actinacidiphila sp. ITFR-21]|uniref:putative lipid II flippase FtsW n=1 Tax=Actinacidiphila sp. ITFR-21 TaxID=3075199 RepID=UPI00288A2C7C|nr:putative lipid II flippase FtsW [Streptomyces sp. ITFR-21]WNI15122.1 putative lipid II flippase FtsW [Streptomyces sp. ITFR-21]